MKKYILLPCMVLAAVLLLSACAGGSLSPETATAPKETQADSGQMLKLSLQKDEENTQAFSAEELGGNFNRGLLYRRVKDVAIEIDGEKIPLEEALAQGKITEEALWYYGAAGRQKWILPGKLGVPTGSVLGHPGLWRLYRRNGKGYL